MDLKGKHLRQRGKKDVEKLVCPELAQQFEFKGLAFPQARRIAYTWGVNLQMDSVLLPTVSAAWCCHQHWHVFKVKWGILPSRHCQMEFVFPFILKDLR